MIEDIKYSSYNIDESYKYSNFSCGNERIDNIFKNQCSVLERKNQAKTTLFYYGDDLLGFCTLLVDTISVSPLNSSFPDGDIPIYYPALHLYAFGVDKRFQGMGIGTTIFNWVIAQGYGIRENVGLAFLVLESFKDEKLLKFYKDDFDLVDWKYFQHPSEDLIPLVFDYRGLNGQI
ncbi:GNAT family N-acetyltransferase [Bacillus haynesii]|uniref:GNAT family N-acetyltransferase n=1 Tax=Bacillus haynesii TaxID=1925021 RepID=UPI0022825CA6|nr:GNAT family N-acetyltransferase [Bacillus haynesii]MCY9435139.1 GNAT family N-acetyltransferase [Bacillus haynesii]MEC0683343.1 GNAT family N-acetyltransferase [Bacillus haynesii]MEC1344857.1 GNAT family N-acetyltransferase [Bacillus haynesii]